MRRLAILAVLVYALPASAAPEERARRAPEDEIEMDAVDATAQPAKKKPAKKARPKKKPKKPKKPKKAPAPEPVPEPEPVALPATPAMPDPEPAPIEPAPPAVIETSPRREARAHVKRFYVRGGFAHVAPLSQSRELELADVDGAASLAIDNGPIAGSGASVSSATIFAAALGYRLNDRFSLEAVLGVPFTVKLRATGTLANKSLAPTALGIPTGVPPLGEELGEAKAAPPVVTVVYQLRHRGAVRPYVGTGASVLFAYGEKVTNPTLTMVGEPEMSIAPAPGVVLQGGVEVKLWRNLYARADLKFIALMMARARVEHVQVATPELPLFDSVEVGTAKMNVWVNPLIFQAGIGSDF